MKQALFIISTGIVIGLAACEAPQTPSGSIDTKAIEAELLSILDAQDQAWSDGDIDRFMESYWKSPDLRFASGGTIQRGWDITKARYERRYPTASVMGTLITGNHEVDVLASDAAVVHGSWKLERDGTPASGLYTLVFKKINDEWVITSDTTTSAQ